MCIEICVLWILGGVCVVVGFEFDYVGDKYEVEWLWWSICIVFEGFFSILVDFWIVLSDRWLLLSDDVVVEWNYDLFKNIEDFSYDIFMWLGLLILKFKW